MTSRGELKVLPVHVIADVSLAGGSNAKKPPGGSSRNPMGHTRCPRGAVGGWGPLEHKASL